MKSFSHVKLLAAILTSSFFLLSFAILEGYIEECDFDRSPYASKSDCQLKSYVALNAYFDSCQVCSFDEDFGICNISGKIVCNIYGVPQATCTKMFTPAVISGSSYCSFQCLVSGSPSTCDSTPLPTLCATCTGCTVVRAVSCQGIVTYDYSGKSTDLWTPSVSECPGTQPLSSIVVSNSCGYKWSFSQTALETTKACPANQCGSQCTAPTYCLREVVYTSGPSVNQVAGYEVEADSSSCPDSPPSVTPVACQYAWSTSSSIVTTPNITTYCPSVDSEICGTCIENSSVICVAAPDVSPGKIVANIATGSCIGSKPQWPLISCSYLWSITSGSYTSPPSPYPAPIPCAAATNCDDACPAAANISCFGSPKAGVYTPFGNAAQCLTTRPTYTVSCQYQWNIVDNTQCPSSGYCGECQENSNVFCEGFVYANSSIKIGTVDISKCAGTKPKYADNVCEYKWSSTTTGTAVFNQACPSISHCNQCQDSYYCVGIIPGTFNIVGIAAIDVFCSTPRPTYPYSVCYDKWSTTATLGESVSIFPTGTPCPSFTKCGTCPQNNNVQCVTVWSNKIIAESDYNYCAYYEPIRPTYADNDCVYKWSLSATSYISPPISTDSCPTSTSLCGTCLDDSKVVCISTLAGTTTTFLATGKCSSPKPKYKPILCSFRCRSGVGTGDVVDCPANGSQPCLCSNPTCSFTSTMECYNADMAKFIAPQYCTGPSVHTYTGVQGCVAHWSYTAQEPYDISGLCPDQQCAQSCCTPLPVANVICIASDSEGLHASSAETVCLAFAAKPTSYVPYTNCKWVCTSTSSSTEMEVTCDSSFVPPCTKCNDPTSVPFTRTRCSNIDNGVIGNAIGGWCGAGNDAVTTISRTCPTCQCLARWSYTSQPPYDLIGLCPDSRCAQSCPTPLPAANVICLTSDNDNGEDAYAPSFDESVCLAVAIKPTSYVPYTNCKWICTSPLPPTSSSTEMEVVCDDSFVSPCKKCNDPTSVPFTRTRCSNVDTGVIAHAIDNWCGTADLAVTTISRRCPTCQWLCRDPTNFARSIPCEDITAANDAFVPRLQCVDCGDCTTSFQAECWNTSSGAFVADNDQAQCIDSRPGIYITAGVPHQCSWECILGNKKLPCNDASLRSTCLVQDCQPCDQTVTKSCWDGTSNSLIVPPSGRCSGTAPTAIVQGIPFCAAACKTCNWGCKSSSGSYKPCTNAEFTTQCPNAGDISCKCDIQRDVQCVDFGSTPASSTTLASSPELCDVPSKPPSTYTADRSVQCQACATTKPYWSGIDCSIEPQIERFDVNVLGSLTVASSHTAIQQDGVQKITYYSAVEFTWECSGSETNIATITMTSPSIAPLKSVVVASFLANTNSFILSLSTLPFNIKLTDVQFYATIGANVVITPSLPSPTGFTITPRCAGNVCTHGSVCDETTGICTCDSTSIWTRGVLCDESICGPLDCVADHTRVDDGSGDLCGYPVVTGDGGESPTQPQCYCKSDIFSGTRCQNECSLAHNTLECSTARGQAALLVMPSPDDSDIEICSCECLGNFGGDNCSTCGLQCKNDFQVNSGCTQCTCFTATPSGYFWFGRLCSCQALSLSLTISKMSSQLYTILESGYTDFSAAVTRVMDENKVVEQSQHGDTDILTDDDKAIFNSIQNGPMKAFMTSLLLSILTDYHDRLVLMGLNNSNLFVRDAKDQYVLNADSITNVISIRDMAFKPNPIDSSLNAVSIRIAIVPQTCHDLGDPRPNDIDAWDPTKAVVNYIDSWLGKDAFIVDLVDPECVGSVCQSTISKPVPNDGGASTAPSFHHFCSSIFILQLISLLYLFIFALN